MKKIQNEHSSNQKKQEPVEEWEKEQQAQLLQEISRKLNQQYARLKIESLVSEEAKEELRQVIFDEINKRKLTHVEELTEHLLRVRGNRSDFERPLDYRSFVQRNRIDFRKQSKKVGLS